MVDYGFNEEDILDEREPVTPFEEILSAAIAEKVPARHFRNVFLQSQFYICESRQKPSEVEKGPPLMIKTEHGPALAVFSSKYRMRLFQDDIVSDTTMWGRDIVLKSPQGVGIILNPKSMLSFQLAAPGLQEIREQLL